MELKVYKSREECPYWSGTTVRRQKPASTEPAEAPAAAERQEDAAQVQDKAAQAVRTAEQSTAASSSGEAWKPGEQLMKRDEDTTAALRRNCGKSLFTAAAISPPHHKFIY